MTPDEKTLLTNMQSVCGVCAPRNISTCEGVITITEHMTPFGSSWMLMENHNSGQKFWVSPETFKTLELFAERIGWRPQ